MHKFCRLVLFCSLFSSPAVLAQSTNIWVEQQAKSLQQASIADVASQGRMLSARPDLMNQLFSDKSKNIVLDIPLPDGGMAAFKLTPTPVMAPGLALKFPELMSYRGVDTQDSANAGRFNISPAGFSGMFLYQGEWVFLSPQQQSGEAQHLSYFRKHAAAGDTRPLYETDSMSMPGALAKSVSDGKILSKTSGDEIRTYRLAVSTSGEYTQANGGTNGAMAELDRLVNRINQIFLTDLSIQFELVENNDQLIFTDASSDPFSNEDSEADLEANQTTIDDIIGAGNYDIGHLLNTNGGGLAFVGVTCVNNFKAQGYTGSRNPNGESFYIDLVIHEFGHQLGAQHTFNAIQAGSCTGGNDGQRSNSSSVEPGSGSTIMAYAGICNPQNLQNNSDPYFHPWSIRSIRQRVDSSGACGFTSTPQNAVPVVTEGQSVYQIPANTPFVLTAQASDTDNDTLTYGWDQINPGGSNGGTSSRASVGEDNGSNPLFRSFSPTTSPTRYFPGLSDVLNGTSTFGEALPSTDRTLNFEVVVRDNLGGVDTQQVEVEVNDNGESFTVTSPATGDTWIGNTPQVIEWEQAGTHLSPISCATVDVMLDADGDGVFDTDLASGVSNSGSSEVVAPSAVSSDARLMLKCSDNIFYAVNPGSFNLTSGTGAIAPVITGQQALSVQEDNSLTVDFDALQVTDPDTNYPDGFSLMVMTGNDYTVDGTTVSPSADFNGDISVDVSVNDGTNDSNIFPLLISVEAINDSPVTVSDSLTISQTSGAVVIDVLANDSDVEDDQLTILSFEYNGTGSMSLSNNQLSYTPSSTFSGSESATYIIADSDGAEATGSISISVTASQPPATNDESGGGSLIWLLGLILASLGQRRILSGNRNKNDQGF